VTGDGATEPKAVLHIEDPPRSLPLIETIRLRRPDVHVLTATQGQVGLALAQRHQPALIVLHLRLPDLPGTEVLRHLKRDDRTTAIPVLTLGPAETASLARDLQRLGATAHFTLPLAPRRFLRVVDTLLA
jgi:DNA-binding response OmpR family regulator